MLHAYLISEVMAGLQSSFSRPLSTIILLQWFQFPGTIAVLNKMLQMQIFHFYSYRNLHVDNRRISMTFRFWEWGMRILQWLVYCLRSNRHTILKPEGKLDLSTSKPFFSDDSKVFLNFSLNLPFFAAKSRPWREKHCALSRMYHLNVAPLHLSWPCTLTYVHTERLQGGSWVYIGKQKLWAMQQKKVSPRSQPHFWFETKWPALQPWFLLRVRG